MKRGRPYRSLLMALLGLALVEAVLLTLARLLETPRARPRSQPAPRRVPAVTLRLPRRVVMPRLPRRGLAAAATVVALIAIVLVGGAFAYDATKADVISPGVRVGNVDVGGLTPAEARTKLRRAYRRLDRPLVVRFEGRRWALRPEEADVHVAVDEAVSRALARSRDGSFLSRAARWLVGSDLDVDLTPRVSFSTAAVGAFAAAVEADVTRPPRAPHITPHAAGLDVIRGRSGVEVDGGRLQRRIERVLTTPRVRRALAVPVRRVRPRLTLADLARRNAAYITVDRAAFKLRLYQHLRLTRTYSIAVGQVGLETPAGLYHIQNKQVDPSWSVPLSSWAGSLAGSVIPPGPSNPLKARWMGIFDGAGIHGTDQHWSLGSAASHGCIRMAIDDVIELYDRVEVGTPIYIG